ncbi:hypothetical protein ABEF95_011367 [Exophiala dermatitidis]
MAPKKRTSSNVIDLLSDDDSEIHIIPPSQYPGVNRNHPDPGQQPLDLPAKLKEQHRQYLQDSHNPSSGRLHGGYDLDTLTYEEHLIPEGQLNCRGCRLSPIEFDENGQEIPATVTHERRQKILTDKFEKKWAEDDAERSNKNATADDRDENPGRREPSVIALDVDPVNKNNNNQAKPARGSLSVSGNANHGSERRVRRSGSGPGSGPIDKQVPEPNPASPQTDARVHESESDIESSTEAGSGSDTELHVPAPTPVSPSELRERRMPSSSSSSVTTASFGSRSLRRSNINPREHNNLDKGKGKGREGIPETEVLELDSGDDDEKEIDVLNVESNGHKHNNGHYGDDEGLEDEDEELRRAISLSLQDQQGMDRDDTTTTTSKNAGASTSSDHHHHHHDHSSPQAKRRKLAHAALLQQRLDGREQIQTQRQQPKPIRDTIVVTSPASSTTTTATTKESAAAPTSSGSISTSVGGGGGSGAGAGGLAGFDRKQMEAERLARLKRKCQSEDGGDAQKSEQEQGRHGGSGGSGTISTSSRTSNTISTTTTATNYKASQQNKDSELRTRSQRAISPPPVRRPTTLPDDRDRVPRPAPAGDHRFSTARQTALTNGGSHSSSIAGPATTSSENKHKNTTASRGDGRTDAPPTGSNKKNSIKLNYYPKGIVLKTQIPGSNDNSTNRTIDFATLISPASALESCLLSSFIWNFDWLFPHFDTKRTKFQLVMHAKQPLRREELKADFGGIPNVRLCFPPMDGIVNCMHSKLMLLFYNDENNSNSQIGHRLGHGHGNGSNAATRCRIVVPTANLVDFDWGVGGVMENTVWMIDLPPATASAAAVKTQAQAELTGRAAAGGSSTPTAFQKSLTAFLRAQTVPEDVIRKLERFDFTETAHLGFVHTIGGMHGGSGGGKEQTWRTTGLPLLGQTITDLGLTPPAARERGKDQGHGPDPVQLDYVTSSLGSLTDEFVSSIYLSAQGDDGLTKYNRRNSTTAAGIKGTSTGGGQTTLFGVEGQKPSAANSSGMFSGGHDDWKENMRVYYPSDETVRRSRGGRKHAGTICFNIKWWHNGKFPQSIMRDCVSVREGLLMHNKIMFVRFAAPVESGNRVGWAYVGSANLSESAWGRLIQDKATKQPKLNCRNWECGVIIPLVAEGKLDPDNLNGKSNSGHKAGLEMFEHLVPVPMRYPGERFEGKKPWTTGMYDY